ncbi:MAG: hypothetical protein K9J12_13760 [Melioribacteraceae bacterium]|nr:hypothetical protein [Melioribacteraceae bacterium]MCF8263170.1 hypothetical protein [Melioribacteraceae bacterium]MCF8430342.1 hypothetical protein [Melioribacteraceae bacterium]
MKNKKIIDAVVIILIFGLTGSATAFLSGYIMSALGAEPWTIQYILGYLVFIFPLYQSLLLLIAFLFGRFDMFYSRWKKLLLKIKKLITY